LSPLQDGDGAVDNGVVRLRLDGLDVPALNKALVTAGIDVEALLPVEGSLEDLFLHLTTKEIS
jgi:hypothetical protein